MQFTPDQERLFKVLAGVEPPRLDPDRLRALGEGFAAVAGVLESLPGDLAGAVGRVRSQFSGVAADAFERSMADFVSGPTDYVGGAREAAGSVARYARSSATNFEYVTYMAIGQLVQLMVEIVWCIVNAFRTFGLSLTLIPVYRAIASVFLRKLLRFLLTHLAVHTVIEVGVSLALDLLIQRIQIGRGTRESIDGNLTRESVIGGALGGVLSGAGAAAVNRLIRSFRKGVGDLTRLSLLDQLDTPTPTPAKTTTGTGTSPTTGAGGGAGVGVVAEAFSDDVAALVTRNQEYLLPAGAKAGFALEGKAAAGLGREFGELFAGHFGPGIGPVAARELGTAYGEVFGRTWGRADAAQALATVLSRPEADGLTGTMRSVLAQLPDTVLGAARSQHHTLMSTLASLGLDSVASGTTEYIAGLFSGLATSGKIDPSVFSFVAGTLNSAITGVSVTGGIAGINTLKTLGTHPTPGPGAPAPTPVLQPVPSTTPPGLTQPAPALAVSPGPDTHEQPATPHDQGTTRPATTGEDERDTREPERRTGTSPHENPEHTGTATPAPYASPSGTPAPTAPAQPPAPTTPATSHTPKAPPAPTAHATTQNPTRTTATPPTTNPTPTPETTTSTTSASDPGTRAGVPGPGDTPTPTNRPPTPTSNSSNPGPSTRPTPTTPAPQNNPTPQTPATTRPDPTRPATSSPDSARPATSSPGPDQGTSERVQETSHHPDNPHTAPTTTPNPTPDDPATT
ncbi:WXG100 family type VII secretion target, partial [Streptomyces sp. ADI93-02]|uniref:WXG100 family type VII secretion target n=1 Tax=Streptomyces sp. ADI93-02 TaxID=1522757 RepID=UPI0019CF6275